MSSLQRPPRPEWLTIRYGEPSDIENLMAMELVSCPHPWSRQIWQRELQTTHSQCLIAQGESAELIGYCLYWVVEDEIEVQNIAVVPAYRGRGIARGLLETLMQNTPRRVVLEVRKSNTAARALYEKTGFSIDAIRPRYYPDGEDAVLMSLR